MNELYSGVIVWNRVRMVKDPTTGKRISRPNKAADYRRAQAPHLRIIDHETWDAAQAIKRGRSNVGATAARKPLRPLSGLLRCGYCGAGMTALGAQRPGKPHRVQCAGFRESGTCSNGRKVSRSAIETLLLLRPGAERAAQAMDGQARIAGNLLERLQHGIVATSGTVRPSFSAAGRCRSWDRA